MAKLRFFLFHWCQRREVKSGTRALVVHDALIDGLSVLGCVISNRAGSQETLLYSVLIGTSRPCLLRQDVNHCSMVLRGAELAAGLNVTDEKC